MPDWMPSLNALRAFEAVARHHSYRAAADELNVTPAAVKQLVTKLEHSLGTTLVTRSGRGIALTRAGTEAAPDLRAAMERMRGTVQKLRAHRAGARLIVTVEASFATTWLVPRLEDFRARHPGISVLIDSAQQIVDLTHSDADVAIRYGVTPDPRLVTHRLFADLVVPACSPARAAGPPALNTLTDLRRAPLIHWDMAHLPWATATRTWFDWGAWGAREGLGTLDTGAGLRFSDYGMAVQAAISGQGVILASWPILQDPLEAGLLVRPFANSARATGIGYDLVTTPEAAHRPEVAAFTDWLRDIAGPA